MSLVDRLFRRAAPERPAALYAAIVAEARDPAWYRDGQAPDTLDGRFDMVALVLSLVLLRIEREGEPGRAPAALLAECFVEDMDGQLRQIGIGDIIVGKHVGRMMAALGGRIGAYREGLSADEPDADLDEALRRNLYRSATVPADALTFTADRMRLLAARLDAQPLDGLIAGKLG